MFQQGQPNQNGGGTHDSNHLEDASVLLSMQYGSGNANDSVPTVQGQRVVADDWAPPPTINMMLESNATRAEQRRSNSASSNGNSTNSTNGRSDGNMNFLGSLELARWDGPKLHSYRR